MIDMHRRERIIFNAVTDFTKLPDFKSHTVDCPKCHYRQPVPVEYTDWKRVAETYKDSYSAMGNGFMELLKEMEEQFDVPLLAYLDAHREVLIATMQGILERLDHPNDETPR